MTLRGGPAAEYAWLMNTVDLQSQYKCVYRGITGGSVVNDSRSGISEIKSEMDCKLADVCSVKAGLNESDSL